MLAGLGVSEQCDLFDVIGSGLGFLLNRQPRYHRNSPLLHPFPPLHSFSFFVCRLSRISSSLSLSQPRRDLRQTLIPFILNASLFYNNASFDLGCRSAICFFIRLEQSALFTPRIQKRDQTLSVLFLNNIYELFYMTFWKF